jgi:hypothetical protein
LQHFRCLAPVLGFGSLAFHVLAACSAQVEVIDELRVVESNMIGIKEVINALMIAATGVSVHSSLSLKR